METKNNKVICEICNAIILKKGLKRHNQTKKCREKKENIINNLKGQTIDINKIKNNEVKKQFKKIKKTQQSEQKEKKEKEEREKKEEEAEQKENKEQKLDDIADVMTLLEREIPFIDKKQFSHNIVGLCLKQISTLYGYKDCLNPKISALVKMYKLDKMGWGHLVLSQQKIKN
jgi:hypothetical protein